MTTIKPYLHFSHANSFPAGSYRKFLNVLAPHYQIGHIETLGHDPRYPVTDCWPHLVEQTIHYVEQHYPEPVIALGHSLGGVLSFMAARQRPDLFRAVVMLDSPVLTRSACAVLWLGKRLGFIERLSPGGGQTLRRRRLWPSRDAAYAHFRRKKMFASWDPDCLRDYIEAGTHPDPSGEGVRLAFSPEVESSIYSSLPHYFPSWRSADRPPIGFIGGESSEYLRRADLIQMRRRFGIEIMQIKGGHLFPFERPDEAAGMVLGMLDKLRNF